VQSTEHTTLSAVSVAQLQAAEYGRVYYAFQHMCCTTHSGNFRKKRFTSSLSHFNIERKSSNFLHFSNIVAEDDPYRRISHVTVVLDKVQIFVGRLDTGSYVLGDEGVRA
jgi:hypothetical protein